MLVKCYFFGYALPMSDAITRAHARLMASLPVHTHYRITAGEREQRGGSAKRPKTTHALTVKNGEPRAVVLQNVRYASVKEAARKLRVTDTCIAKRIKRGLGRYL